MFNQGLTPSVVIKRIAARRLELAIVMAAHDSNGNLNKERTLRELQNNSGTIYRFGTLRWKFIRRPYGTNNGGTGYSLVTITETAQSSSLIPKFYDEVIRTMGTEPNVNERWSDNLNKYNHYHFIRANRIQDKHDAEQVSTALFYSSDYKSPYAHGGFHLIISHSGVGQFADNDKLAQVFYRQSMAHSNQFIHSKKIEKFMLAMFEYDNAMPFDRGSAWIGAELFKVLYFYVYQKKAEAKSFKDLDVFAMLSPNFDYFSSYFLPLFRP